MANSTDIIKPVPGKNDLVQFAESHRVSLYPGLYKLRVEHQLSGDDIVHVQDVEGENVRVPVEPWESVHQFAVMGERYQLPGQAIRAVFPPKGSQGDYWRVLPHLILERSTLPWERSSERSADPFTAAPWLALLVFHEDEEPAVTQEQRVRDDLNHEEERVNAISVKKEKLPSLEDLRNLTHIRRRLANIARQDSEQNFESKESALGAIPNHSAQWHEHELISDAEKNAFPNGVDQGWIISDAENKEKYEILKYADNGFKLYRVAHEAATIIANRLPKKGEKNVVHLVSLEEMYPLANQDNFKLVSLYQWSFRCEDATKNFKGLFDALDIADWHMEIPVVDDDITPFLNAGMVPLQHFFREGSQSISWYRGPLKPMHKSFDTQTLFTQLDATNTEIRHPDQLLQFNKKQGVFDITYASAWELGRMLTLQNTDVAIKLYNWKRTHAHQLHAARYLADYKYPLANGITEEHIDPDTTAIQSWLDDLSLLKEVPFRYLVPHEGMLPSESIRFFQIDPLWMKFLRDGAFSIGRVTEQDAKTDVELKEQKIIQKDNTYTGFIMRSELISGWPDIQIAAYKTLPDTTEEQPFQTNPKVIHPIRTERLSPQVLLMIFEEEIVCLDFYLTPDTLHFGFDLSGGSTDILEPDDLLINLRDPEDGQLILNKSIDLNNVIDNANFKVNTERLAEKLKLEMDRSEMKSNTLALQLVAGSDLIRIKTPV